MLQNNMSHRCVRDPALSANQQLKKLITADDDKDAVAPGSYKRQRMCLQLP